MSTTLGPSPGGVRHPQHSVLISAGDEHWSVWLDKQRLADSRRVLLVEESGYDRVIYFPSDDVYTDSLLQSDTRTTCPFKGEAKYFAADIAGRQTDIAWYYPSVYDEVAAIAGYVAFYGDRVDISSESIDAM